MLDKMAFKRRIFDGDTEHISDAIVSESLTSNRSLAEVAGDFVSRHNFSQGQLANIVAQTNRAMTNAVRDLKPKDVRGNYSFSVLTVDDLTAGKSKSASKTPPTISEPNKKGESYRSLRRNLYVDPSYRTRLSGTDYDPFFVPKEKTAKRSKGRRVRIGEVVTLEEMGKCKEANLAGFVGVPTSELANSFDDAVKILKLHMKEDRYFSTSDVCQVLRQLGVSEDVLLEIGDKPMKVSYRGECSESAPIQVVLNIKHPITKAMLRVATLFAAMTRNDDDVTLDDEDELVGSVAFSDSDKAERAFAMLEPKKGEKKASKTAHKKVADPPQRNDVAVTTFLSELGI